VRLWFVFAVAAAAWRRIYASKNANRKTDQPEKDVAGLEMKQQLKNGEEELTCRSSC